MNEEINIEDKKQEMKEDGFEKLMEEFDREFQEQLEKRRLNSEKRKAKALKKKMKEIELFREEIGVDSGYILDCNDIFSLLKVYKNFMNKSDVLIMRDSKIINHIVPSKNNRLVVMNVDCALILKDAQNGNLFNLQMKCCNKYMKYCNTFCEFLMNINYDAQRKSYQFKDSFHEIYIPALDDGQVDNYIHEIDFFNEIRMDLGLSYKTESKHTEIYNLFFRFIDNKLPFDILIRENKIIGFYQNGQIFKTFNVEKNKTISCNDADVILRVHNFMFFNKQHIPAYNFNVIKNGDGQYWFLIKGMLKISGEYLINIYENIELIR